MVTRTCPVRASEAQTMSRLFDRFTTLMTFALFLYVVTAYGSTVALTELELTETSLPSVSAVGHVRLVADSSTHLVQSSHSKRPYSFSFGFPKSNFVIQTVGNETTRGVLYSFQTPQWRVQLATATTASGLTSTFVDSSHDGYRTGDLTALIATEVDVNWDAAKNNILLFQEVQEDLRYGVTGQQAYDNVVTYMNGLANPWTKIVLMPTPIDSADVTQPGYEQARQNFIALVNSDPTFNGTVHRVVRLDQDERIGTAGNENTTYYFLNDKIHFYWRGHAIMSSAVLDALRVIDTTRFKYIPAHMPFPAFAFSAATAGSVLAASGGAATNGQNVATWNSDNGVGGAGNLVQGTDANRPTYNTTGFGGKPAISISGAQTMVTTSTAYWNRGTLITSGTTSAQLARLLLGNGTPPLDDRLIFPSTSPNNLITYEYNSNTAQGALQTTSTTNAADGSGHTVTVRYNGTFAGQRAWIDGKFQALTYVAPYNQNAYSADTVATLTVSGAGLVGEVYGTPIELNDNERRLLEGYIATLRSSSLTESPWGRYVALGDSITVGQGASFSYVTSAGSTAKIPTTNVAVAGDQAWEVVRKAYTNVVGDGDVVYSIMIGANDQRQYLTDANKRQVYREALMNAVYWLGTYGGHPTWGNSISGGQTGSFDIGKMAGVTFNVLDATWTFTNVRGNSLWLSSAYRYLSPASTTQFTVSIDGVSQGTFYNDPPGHVDPLTINNTSIAGRLLRFPGLTYGPHTVVLGISHLTYVDVFDWAFLGSNSDVRPNVKIILCTITPQSSGFPLGGSAANLALYNAEIAAVAAAAQQDGLNVVVADTGSVINPATDLFDSIHPNDSGQTKLAAAILPYLQSR